LPTRRNICRLLSSLIREAASSAVDDFVLRWEGALLVSELAAAEVASGLSKLVRLRRFEAADAALRLTDFDS
jgi:hypothetical protein